MADIVAGESYVSPETRGKRDGLAQRVLVIVIIALALILAGELVYHIVIAPRLRIETISIESDLELSDEQLLSLAGLSTGAAFFSVDVDAAEARLRGFPLVREAQVETTFPNRVSVSVARRRPLAAALAMTDDGTVPLVFDEEGVVFQIGMDPKADLPIVSGLRFTAVELGIQLPALVVDFLTQLREIKLNEPELYRLFSEYRIVQKNDYAYEVVLYPVHYRLPVRIGTSIDADMIEYVMMMLDVLQKEDRIATLSELDFRSGEGVLRPRTEEGEANG